MKEKIRQVSKVTISLVIVFSLLLVTLIGLTMAYFTDSKSYTGTLSFGDIKLKVTDNSGDTMEDGANVVFDITRTGTVTTKLMPGDTVSINFNVGLDTGSQPAYYLVSVSDSEGILDNATYYHNGTTVVTNTETEKSVGLISEKNADGTYVAHKFSISTPIPADTDASKKGTSTEVTVKVYAVQKANLTTYDATNTDKSAYHILNGKMTVPTDGVNWSGWMPSGYTNTGSPVEMGFYYTKDVPSGYTLDATLTTNLNNSLDNKSKGYMSVYKGESWQWAIASDYKIYAPTDMSYKFGGVYGATLTFSNFDTSKTTNMKSMFAGIQEDDIVITGLNNFDTSNVTDMSYMFQDHEYSALDLSSFNTSKVTNWTGMFSSYRSFNITIGDNFVYGGTGDVSTCTQFTLAVLKSKTGFDGGKVTRNGVTLS